MDAGFEPVIWVAPFSANEQSRLFRERSEWFVMHVQGKLLRSDRGRRLAARPLVSAGWGSSRNAAMAGNSPRGDAPRTGMRMLHTGRHLLGNASRWSPLRIEGHMC